MRPLSSLLLFLLLFTCDVACGAVRCHSLISDGMVLRRAVPITIWGTADKGERVAVVWQEQTYTTIAADDGTWSVTLPPTEAGGPYELRVGDTIIRDVLVGEVWLCSGQSNMELPVSRVVDMFGDEIAAYENTNIRHVLIPRITNFHGPQDALPAVVWQPATHEYVMSFSALAYFFARAYYEATGIPVGLVNAAWGGTPIEAWLSAEAAAPWPQCLQECQLYADDDYCALIRAAEHASSARWSALLYATDRGLHDDIPWYSPSLDDSGWATIDMFDREWIDDNQPAAGGAHWLRQTLTLPKSWESGDVLLRLGCLVDADSVYVNGQFVGTTAYQYPPRKYPLPAGLLHEGDNNITVRIISNGARPSFVPEKPYKLIRTAAGEETEELPLSTVWRYRRGTALPSAPGSTAFSNKPLCLYNAMIAPLRHYALSGVIWYQGESNVGRHDTYRHMLPALMTAWRTTFSSDALPFYIVELASFLSPSDTGGQRAWAAFRAMQAAVADSDDNAYLIKNEDLGEWNDIHPLNKKTLGERVLTAVLAHEATTTTALSSSTK